MPTWMSWAALEKQKLNNIAMQQTAESERRSLQRKYGQE